MGKRLNNLNLIILMVFWVTSTSGVSAIADGQDKGGSSVGPQAIFSDLRHDAGTVEAGGELVHTFMVRNGGTADLVIEKIKPS